MILIIRRNIIKNEFIFQRDSIDNYILHLLMDELS